MAKYNLSLKIPTVDKNRGPFLRSRKTNKTNKSEFREFF